MTIMGPYPRTFNSNFKAGWGMSFLLALALLFAWGTAFGDRERLFATGFYTGTIPQASSQSGDASAQDEGVPGEILARVEEILKTVTIPDVQALSRALKANVQGESGVVSVPSVILLTKLGDLDGDGVPEMALTWSSAEPTGPIPQEQERSSSWLFLLAWDGTRWRASPLASAAVSFQTIRLARPASRGIAVLVAEGEDGVPYPTIFQVKDHTAIPIWRGNAEESRYEGYQHARVEFRDPAGDDPSEMFVSGRADPGLLVFAKEGRRGFDAHTLYRWDGRAYIPVKMDYTFNPDFILYRFISALHLHNFRAAYALISPEKFLNTDAPSLETFRQLVEDSWPELLDDRVFEAREATVASPEQYAFALPEEHYVYVPKFSTDGKYLLTGLERRTETEKSDAPQ